MRPAACIVFSERDEDTDLYIAYTFDPLYREVDRVVRFISSEHLRDRWTTSYVGPTRVVEKIQVHPTDDGKQLIETQLNNARTRSMIQEGQSIPGWGSVDGDRLGYDGSGRHIATRTLITTIDGNGEYAQTSPFPTVHRDGFLYGYDKAGNKLFSRRLGFEKTSEIMFYDSMDRLVETLESVIDPNDHSQIQQAIDIPGTLKEFEITYDLQGNRQQTLADPVDDTPVTMDYGYDPYDKDQISTVTTNGVPESVAYDSFGNMLFSGCSQLFFIYDELRRLAAVLRRSDGATIALYDYDAFGLRWRKRVYNGGVTGDQPDTTTTFSYDQYGRLARERCVCHVPYGSPFAIALSIPQCCSTRFTRIESVAQPLALGLPLRRLRDAVLPVVHHESHAA